MLPLLGSSNMARLDVSLEHALIERHDGFSKLVTDVLSFFVAKPRCAGVIVSFDCGFSVLFSLSSTRESVT
jgi:hypothetical protein